MRAVGVVVPARDEEAYIERCLDSVVAALLAARAATPALQVAVCVVLDRCTDATAARAGRVGAGVDVELVHNDQPLTVGELRDRGLRRLLRRPSACGPAWVPGRTWLLSTDADTVVGRTWVLDQLRHAAAGADAVAGLADLADPAALSAAALRAYQQLLARGERPGGHAHVYGANLGVRADAYLAVGGFPAIAHGEDHGLANRLRAAGYRLVTATDGRVTTSARLRGRAGGGLADLLQALH